jgi:prephenate dehydrogenase
LRIPPDFRAKKGALLMDACGTKRAVCAAAPQPARAHGFTFIGGHPMAGSHQSGFAHARAALFRGAPMILCPCGAAEDLLRRAENFFLELGFAKVIVTTPEEHDRRIAFTSQLPHVISNAYIKSPANSAHSGFSAGSYRDFSRVARLNVPLWSHLFLDNADCLGAELDFLIENLSAVRAALCAGDRDTLAALLTTPAQEET